MQNLELISFDLDSHVNQIKQLIETQLDQQLETTRTRLLQNKIIKNPAEYHLEDRNMQLMQSLKLRLSKYKEQLNKLFFQNDACNQLVTALNNKEAQDKWVVQSIVNRSKQIIKKIRESIMQREEEFYKRQLELWDSSKEIKAKSVDQNKVQLKTQMTRKILEQLAKDQERDKCEKIDLMKRQIQMSKANFT